MNIIIFGATGTVGKNLVEQALNQGHNVTAFTRSPNKITLDSENLKVVKGDVLDQTEVTKAIENQDAVLCALGMPLMNKEGLRAAGTNKIITAMTNKGVKRLICLSGLGAGDSKAILPFHYKYIIAPLLMKRLFADHTAQEAFITKSTLDWTIARPGNFTKGTHTGAYHQDTFKNLKGLKLKISPEDVADFMIKQLTSANFLKKQPIISY